MNRIFSIAFSLLFMITAPAWAIDIKINDTRDNNFYMDALNFILEKSGADYKFVSTNHPLSSQARKIILVKNGEVDILYAGTSMQLEKDLLPIRFPIMRGLIGRRIFIINKNYQADYAQVKNLSDLKKFVGIQGIGWGDTQVLEASGLEQEERLYDEIFESLNLGSRYYLPRGMTEVFAELIDKKKTISNLDIEKNILLVYKTAVLFFINPENTELEDVLNSGFIKAYEDGSYNRFFYSHPLIKSAFEQSKLQSRIKIEIPNPFLGTKTEAIPHQYWHQDY